MKKLRLELIIFILFSCFIIFPVSAQENLLTLQKAIEIGLENNYDIRIAHGNAEIAENNVSAGNAGMLPTLDLSGGISGSKERVDQTFKSGDRNEKSHASSTRYSADATMNWTLFDGTSMFFRYDRLKEEHHLAKEEAKAIIQDAIANIIKSYYQVVLEQEKLTVLQQTLDISEERTELAESKYEVGKGSKLDFLSAQVDFNEDNAQYLLQKETLQKSRIQLNNYLARESPMDFRVTPEINIDSTLQRGTLHENLLDQNPQLQAGQSNVDITNLYINELKGQAVPQIDLNVGYGYNLLESQAGFLSQSKSLGLNYNLTATWTIFNGFVLKNQLQNAKIAIENSQLALEKSRLQLISDLNSDFITYENRLEMMNLEQSNVQVARENETIALERYRIGISNPLELREAQLNRIEAENRLLESKYNTKIAEVDLLLISGSLTTGS